MCQSNLFAIFCLLCDWNASQAMPFQYFAESVNK